jgi:hypothetical protein
MDIEGDGSLLGCFACGCVFVSKTTRQGEAAGIKEQIHKQESEALPETELPPRIEPMEAAFKCDLCGKEVKTALALNGHMRSHKPDEAAA